MMLRRTAIQYSVSSWGCFVVLHSEQVPNGVILDIWGNVMIPLALKYLWLMIPLAYDTFG